MSFWHNLLSGQGFPARRFCGVWDGPLIALHVGSDVVIWLSYLWIPFVMLWSYYAQKKAIRLTGPLLLIFLLYIIFITACGWTHFFDALMFFNPIYRLNGLVRAITAVASLATAVTLVWLVPRAITAPVTIVAQQTALHQQYLWLRDIMDSATEGCLKLCETRADLPPPLGEEPSFLSIAAASDLRPARQIVDALAQRAHFARPRSQDLLSAVHEAAMNAWVHAGGATLRAYQAGETVQFWIEDEGTGIPLDKLPLATLKQGYSTAGTAGQGWYMILNFVDTAYLLTGPNGTSVVLEMSRTSTRQALPFPAALGGQIAT